MALALTGSVGKNAKNFDMDVRLIQALINSFDAWKKPIQKIKVDGNCGKKTREVIKAYQAQAVGMAPPNPPDTVVDIHGKTFRYLTMYLSTADQAQIKKVIHSSIKSKKLKPIVTKKLIATQAGLQHLKVTYKSTLPKGDHIVSSYSMNIIKMILKECGMTHAVITSTIRLPEEQASIMYKNALKDYGSQERLYGKIGGLVLKIFKANKKKSKEEVIQLMTTKIVDLANSKLRVSKHVVTKDQYLKTNVIDIGIASTRKISKNFNIKKFTNACKKLKKEGYIEKFIDETKKTNKAWHLEIKVGKKSLYKDIDASILSPIRWC